MEDCVSDGSGTNRDGTMVSRVPVRKKSSQRLSSNWSRESWITRLRERLQEEPLFLKNLFAYERGPLIGGAQSKLLTGDKFSSKILLVSSSVTTTMAEDVEGFESCVEADRIGCRFYIEKGTTTVNVPSFNCMYRCNGRFADRIRKKT